MIKQLVVLFIIIFCSSCGQQDKPSAAFYFWKTNFKLSEVEINTLAENNVKKIYVRYFDIDLDSRNQPLPVSPIHFETKTSNFAIVPVIYIKNKVMLDSSINIDDLAQKTFDFIKTINSKNQIAIQEIQIDCDWTLNSRDNYLKFIESFKKISAVTLSATIRLHQIKYYKKTKIPAVDKGVLMYYNMGVIAADSLNSIYDPDIAGKYVESLKNYPLQLDVALPIYSWAVHSRENRVIGLRNKIEIYNFKNDSNFVFVNDNIIKVKHSNYKLGRFYKADDILKLEAISKKQLLEMGFDLKQNLKSAPTTIIFYDLDELNIKKYEKDIFKQVIAHF